jgi:type I restriction enzyme S subunit
VSELPKGWSFCSLFDVTKPKQWKTIPTKELLEEGYPLYGANGIIGKYSSYTHEESTIMITCRGASCGNIHISQPKSYINGNAMALDNLSKHIYIKYLYYFLRSANFSKVISGTAQPQITQEGLHNLTLLIAPLNEQIRIADKLDSMLAKVDTAQARLDKIPNILKRFRQSVLAAATSGELTKEWRETNEIDFSGWNKSIMSEVAKTLDPNPSHRYPKADISGVPILSTQQFVGESGWTTDKAKLVNRTFFEERKAKTGFYPDDIIFARKGRLGLARYAPKKLDYVLSHTVFIVRPGVSVIDDFLLLSLKENSVMEWLIKEMNSNTGVPTLGKGVFEKVPIRVPTIAEQNEIVRRVEELFAHANTVEKQYNDAKARTNRLTQSILAKAFRGELVQQDSNDEPASKLLARIKAEQAKLSKGKIQKTKKTANA